MKKKILIILLYMFAVFSLIYFAVMTVKLGPGYRFNFVWLLLGLFLIGTAFVLTFSKQGVSRLPKPVLFLIETIILAGCLLFVVVEGMIIWKGNMLPENNADYLVVLGAQVRGTKPSLVLKYRIEKAAEYLKAHPDVKVVASGGKGADEEISEAEAIERGLIERGIDQSRIYKEERSTSTKENLEFSKQYLDIEHHNIIIVTSDFHILRAVGIARKAGYRNVEGLAAKSVWYLVPNNYVREFLALMKDKLVGNC